MDFFPEYFANVEPGSFNESVCSPSPPAGDGVLINAPARITLEPGETVVLPICGQYQVPALVAMQEIPMTVTVQHLESGLTLSGVVLEEGENEPEVPPPDEEEEFDATELQGVSVGGYFNIDAQKYLGAPLAPGSYEVSVSFAGTESRPARVEIVLRVQP